MTTEQYAAANRALKRGFHIFPCEPNDKLPAQADNGYGYRIKWYEYATNEHVMVAQWWSYQPEFNIGISCRKSGLLVVDCDMPKDPNETRSGVDQFHDLCRKYGASWMETTRTYQVSTPSGGRHFYYRWPPEVIASQRSPDTMLDVRTNGGEKGGYVVGAGSRTAEGWYREVRSDDVRQVPMWLQKHIEAPPEKNKFEKADNFDRPHSPNFAGLHRSIREAREGNRNHALNWAVYKAVQGNPDMTLDQVESEFMDSARDAGLNDREIRATMRSAYNKAKR